MAVRIPWCRTCRFRRTAFLCAMALGGVIGFYTVLFFIRFALHPDQNGVLTWMAIGLGVALGLTFVRYVLPEFFPPFRLPGHAQFCDAYSDTADAEGILHEVETAAAEPVDPERAYASLYLRNRAFAQRWRALNKPVQGENE